ncbi:MAG: HPr family phosphocarrier protein [Holosporales bacterium]|nr:HPr family phosphocarrier protein [Holosporales bacterium]
MGYIVNDWPFIVIQGVDVDKDSIYLLGLEEEGWVPKIVSHFVVTHPLGMHARVCSKWIKFIQKLRSIDMSDVQEWAWLEYEGRSIPADSLFKLLEARIPCGAEFDLVLDDSCLYDVQVGKELAHVISLEAFELPS